MGLNVFEKIIKDHLVEGNCELNHEISIRIDQTLTQDSLGALAYLQFEALEREKVQTELSVSYTDHLLLQLGEGNADVHRYLETVADNFGIVYSKAGNGICHQLHLERFSSPGKTLLGGDSHTVTCGAVGMLALGAGGLDVALAMAGIPFYMKYPKVVKVHLINKLNPCVTAKDVALELLRMLTTKGNVTKVLEYGGQGLNDLSITQRATIANMGAEAGVVTSIFPSDQKTREFLRYQNRESDWHELVADEDAIYDDTIEIDLDLVEPNVAIPHSPDNVYKIKDLDPIKVDQVLIGSCTNSSYSDLMSAAMMLRGRKVKPEVSFGVSVGSHQVMAMLAASEGLRWFVEAGARVLESGCGFCVGQGQAPEMNAISIRTNNRNYKGRSGTQSAKVYLCSPETAAASAINGYLTDPRLVSLGCQQVTMPEYAYQDDSMFLFPTKTKDIYRSSLIGTPPSNSSFPLTIHGQVAIKVSDKINTDDIIPGGAAMSYRANVEKSTEFIFQHIDPEFPLRCKSIMEQKKNPIIVAGESYGQGSSREHAAICPMVMGVKCVIAKSIERIHTLNLINFGILPLTFLNPDDFDSLELGDIVNIPAVSRNIFNNEIIARVDTKNLEIRLQNQLTRRQAEIVLAGGTLNKIKKQKKVGVNV